jgi:hypothetical protein
MHHNTKVQTFLQDLEFSGGQKFQIVEKLLEIFFELYPQMTTDIKYGGLIILLENQFVGGIFVYRSHVSLEFGRGYLLQDPNKILLGGGQFRRHLKFENLQDIEKLNPGFFINQISNL